jgi:hypothetical protein
VTRSQVINCTPSEVATMVDGAMHHGTAMLSARSRLSFPLGLVQVARRLRRACRFERFTQFRSVPR